MAIVKHNEGSENEEGDWSSPTGTADNGTYAAKPGMGRWQQLGLFLSLTGGGVIIGALAALLVIFFMVPHVKMMDMATVVTDHQYLGVGRTVQVVSTMGLDFQEKELANCDYGERGLNGSMLNCLAEKREGWKSVGKCTSGILMRKRTVKGKVQKHCGWKQTGLSVRKEKVFKTIKTSLSYS